MQLIDRMYEVTYSELAQRCLDDVFASDFSVHGRFVAVGVKGRKYWYFDMPGAKGGKIRRYVGPVDDPEISSRVERFKDLKADARARRKLVSTLVREARLPRPDRMSGDIVEALANAGFFRLRGVLVGTTAFQTYSALLGVRLPGATLQTGDADFAQFQSISAAVGESLPPMLDILRQVDPTFRESPHRIDGRRSSAYISRSGFRVEFLTPNVGSDDLADRAADMPALGGASATPLRFLDFLIHEPVRAIVLHRFGVPVLVPAPERFAVHKLIVATRRRTDNDGTAKRDKDLRQAIALTEALAETRRGMDLSAAWREAWSRGPHWRAALAQGLATVDAPSRGLIETTVRDGLRELGDDPAQFGLSPAS